MRMSYEKFFYWIMYCFGRCIVGWLYASTTSCKKIGKTTCTRRLDPRTLRIVREMDTGTLEKIEGRDRKNELLLRNYDLGD